jgi:hypothetical protein
MNLKFWSIGKRRKARLVEAALREESTKYRYRIATNGYRYRVQRALGDRDWSDIDSRLYRTLFFARRHMRLRSRFDAEFNAKWEPVE